MQSLPGVADLLDRFVTFRYSLFRLETLQVYGGSGEEDAIAAFQAGKPIPLTPALQEWTQMVRQRVSSGCPVQRVHVITSPLTDYLRFELASYAPNVQAGEDVRIIPVSGDGFWPQDVPHGDFWLIDSSELWRQHYDQDGTWLGTELVVDPGEIIGACYACDAALHHSTPWRAYLARHPELERRLISAWR